MPWRIAHWIIIVLYLAAPVVVITIDLLRARRRKRAWPGGSLVATICGGIALGTTLSIVYAIVVHARLQLTQLGLAIYFATGLLMVLKGFDWLLKSGHLALVRSVPAQRNRSRFSVSALGGTLRVALLFGIGLPYLMAAIMTYRPKVVPSDDPRKQLGYNFERVSFKSSDGVRIVGWWIPAIKQTGRRGAQPPASAGQNTVIACHGLASNKSNQLILSRGFVPNGYNVLIFDFRAHGESGGQLSSFGDLERRDVLAAVRYLREQRPQQSQHIFGVGASMGAAALIAAAADASPEGQAIEAVAVYGTYDSLAGELRTVSREHFLSPMRWAVDHLGLPFAGAQVGADLNDFSPAREVERIWPRPILVIHGTRDEVIDFEHGRRLFDAASQPKERIWLENADHNGVISDDNVARRVREFFDHAQPVPII